MRKRLRALGPFALALLALHVPAQNSSPPDRRLTEIRHLNLTYTFPAYRTKEEWQARAAHLRRQILVSAGLWPEPSRTPLRAEIFGRLDRGDHTIEKVFFESLPGHYVTGNLYRPKNVAGRAPAVLCPHGHWTYGRLENTPVNSGPARAVNFARQGYVALLYDMVGYNDSAAISHRFGGARQEAWGLNLLGLQLWNSLRAVDFLLTLPEVDPDRLAATGESGGGTQTFLLAAVDDRIKVAAPVNMISAHMQGGDLCENAPGLRIETNNMEFGAMMAPRPLLLVSATGDWTKNTLEVEYPAIRSIYRLFGSEDRVAAVRFEAPHNYHQPSREAVYGFFAHHLLGRQAGTPIPERSAGAPPIQDQLVFFSRPRPAGELSEEQLTEAWIAMARRQLAAAEPRDETTLAAYREQFGTAFRYALQAELPASEPVTATRNSAESLVVNGRRREGLVLRRSGVGDQVRAQLWSPVKARPEAASILIVETPESAKEVDRLAEGFVDAGIRVLRIIPFTRGAGEQVPPEIKFFTTYNRTDLANRVQDILTAISYLKAQSGKARLDVVAPGRGGLWALLARGLAPDEVRFAIDLDRFNNRDEAEFLERLPVPGLKRAGDLETAVRLVPPSPLLLYNAGAQFDDAGIRAYYGRFGRASDLRMEKETIDASVLLAWLRAR